LAELSKGQNTAQHSVRWMLGLPPEGTACGTPYVQSSVSRSVASSFFCGARLPACSIIEQERMDYMRNVLSSLLAALLVISLAGCLPSFDPKAEEHFNQGLEYRQQENSSLAMEEFTKAIEIDPDYYYAYYNRARGYCENGDLESCLADYNKAIELNPDNVYWTIERGFLHMELGDKEKAIIDLERVQELGIPYEYKQRVDEALAKLKP
jgi:tetratricopeptide (TPR) repeat protein